MQVGNDSCIITIDTENSRMNAINNMCKIKAREVIFFVKVDNSFQSKMVKNLKKFVVSKKTNNKYQIKKPSVPEPVKNEFDLRSFADFPTLK